jgi:hypothetical protein
MKVWVTRYALTKGILEVESSVEDGRMVRTTDSWAAYCHKPDWHMTKAEAVERAEEMRKRKPEALRKQVVKLEGMRFDGE